MAHDHNDSRRDDDHHPHAGAAPHRTPAWASVFACGVLTGAALGLALAPARGRETRRAVVDATRRGRERASMTLERGRQAASRQRARMDAFKHTGRSQVHGIRESVAGRAQAAREAWARTAHLWTCRDGERNEGRAR